MARRLSHPSEESKLTAEISVYCDPELKKLACEAADAAEVPLSEYVAQVLAREFRRPDLAKVPRKAMGRPRKEIMLNSK